MMNAKDTLLSRYYGVYTIKVKYMSEVTCFIMDNLIGKDLTNIERIYDLKGSTKGRRAKLVEPNQPTGMSVLKDLNFVEINDSLKITQEQRNHLLEIMETDSIFL